MLDRGSRPNRSGLTAAEIREFGELYRKAVSDLAIARAESRDPRLINYLNALVIRAHGQIYRAENDGRRIIKRFFVDEFPQAFRRNSSYMLTSCAVFLSFVLFGFLAAFRDPEFTRFVGLSGVNEMIRSNFEWWKSLNEANQIGASFILSNNIIVSIQAFAMGAFFGIGSLYDVAYFGAHVGGVFGAAVRLNPSFALSLSEFVVGHGVVELSTVVFCGGAGLMIGWSVVNPGDLPRLKALRLKGIDAAKIVIGSACFLVVAGLIEGFISPSALPSYVKYAVGVGTGIAMYSYLLFAGKEKKKKAGAN
ncbi:MAG: hypothetical protein C4325_04185 [Blastocatellia bacterium]